MQRATITALLAASCATPALAQVSPDSNVPASTAQTVAPAGAPQNTLPVSSPQMMVVTATRVPTTISEIPAGVTVVTRQEMEQRGYTTLVEALSAVPGLHAVQSGGPGGNASVFIRGTDSNAVLVLLDGMPINDASDPGSAFNFGVDTLSDIERIEIIRGPMASLYGSGAIGGVINLITKRGEGPTTVSGEIAGGYPRQVLGNGSVSGQNGIWDYALTAESQSLEGFDQTPQRESIYTGVPDGYRDQIATINLGVTPVTGTRISGLLRARTSTFGFNNLGNPTFDDANSTGNDTNLIGRVGVDSKLFGGTYETGLFLGHVEDDRRYTESLNPNDPNQATEDDRYHGYRWDLQWNNTVHLSDLASLPALSGSDLTFGYEHIADSANVRVNSSSFGSPFTQGVRASQSSDGFYAGLQTILLDRLVAIGQVRDDTVSNSGSAVTWRLGGTLELPEIDSHLHAAYGTAFLAPSLFDRYGVDNFGFVGNPNLLPERAQGWEAGITTDLPGYGRSDFVSVGATYFNNQVRNLIETVFEPTDTEVNVGSAQMQGVETELTVRPANWLSATADYTYTEAINADTQTQLLRRPQHTASFDATITPIPKLIITPELLYTGPFQDFLVANNGFQDGVGTASPGFVFNLTVNYALTPNLTLLVNGKNLTDSRFEPASGYQIPGPSFLAGLRAQL
jgi:vitamin B12 transporter